MTPDIGLANWFLQRALRSPERKALRFEGRDWTYAEMQQAIEDCAARLVALGMAKGERVAFLGLNQPMFFFAMFATARLGAIFVPLNFRLTGPELAFMIEDCAASALIVDAQHRAVIEPQLPRLKSLKATLLAEDKAHWKQGAAPTTNPVRVGEDDVAHDPLHFGHHRPAEGRDADPWQFLVEQLQWHAYARLPRRRCHADSSAGLPHRRSQRDDPCRLAKGRARRAASNVRSRPRARRHRRA